MDERQALTSFAALSQETRLAIVRTLVEAHGGRVTAENGVDGGAVFRVEWPAAGAKNRRNMEQA